MDSRTLLKKVARGIRYRTLNNLIGRKITIRSYKTIVIDIRSAIGNLLPDILLPSFSLSMAAIAKYGIIDLSVKVPDMILKTNYRSGTK